jgi:hypothetical protein
MTTREVRIYYIEASHKSVFFCSRTIFNKLPIRTNENFFHHAKQLMFHLHYTKRNLIYTSIKSLEISGPPPISEKKQFT